MAGLGQNVTVFCLICEKKRPFHREMDGADNEKERQICLDFFVMGRLEEQRRSVDDEDVAQEFADGDAGERDGYVGSHESEDDGDG